MKPEANCITYLDGIPWGIAAGEISQEWIEPPMEQLDADCSS